MHIVIMQLVICISYETNADFRHSAWKYSNIIVIINCDNVSRPLGRTPPLVLTELKHVWSYTSKMQTFQVKVKVTLLLTVSQSVRLGVEPNLGLLTRDLFSYFFFFKVTVLPIWGRPL
jgi:hypothetical protein